jgi:hypothetical protein
LSAGAFAAGAFSATASVGAILLSSWGSSCDLPQSLFTSFLVYLLMEYGFHVSFAGMIEDQSVLCKDFFAMQQKVR